MFCLCKLGLINLMFVLNKMLLSGFITDEKNNNLIILLHKQRQRIKRNNAFLSQPFPDLLTNTNVSHSTRHVPLKDNITFQKIHNILIKFKTKHKLFNTNCSSGASTKIYSQRID